MFSALIRRKPVVPEDGGHEITFESTTVSLSTNVPRPTERRREERFGSMLRVAKLTNASGEQQLVKIKNLSAGGLMAIVPSPPQVGDAVHVELSSQKIPSTAVWSRDDLIGIKFDQPGLGQKQPDGSFKGFDVDVANYVAKELGYTGDTNDSATMNIWLHKQVMAKLAANGGKLPADVKW